MWWLVMGGWCLLPFANTNELWVVQLKHGQKIDNGHITDSYIEMKYGSLCYMAFHCLFNDSFVVLKGVIIGNIDIRDHATAPFPSLFSLIFQFLDSHSLTLTSTATIDALHNAELGEDRQPWRPSLFLWRWRLIIIFQTVARCRWYAWGMCVNFGA